jgi:hypothetical protein
VGTELDDRNKKIKHIIEYLLSVSEEDAYSILKEFYHSVKYLDKDTRIDITNFVDITGLTFQQINLCYLDYSLLSISYDKNSYFFEFVWDGRNIGAVSDIHIQQCIVLIRKHKLEKYAR